MNSFRSLTSDPQPLEEFKRRASQFTSNQLDATQTGLTLDLYEWPDNTAPGVEKCGLKSVQDLESKSEGIVRVILAPRDEPARGKTEALAELFETYSIPSAFIDESLRQVSQSFAVREDVDGTMCIWFHLLCKTKVSQASSQEDFSWTKSGIVMRIRKQSTTPPKPVRTSTSDSDDTLTGTPIEAKVELICFGAPPALQDRLQGLITMTTGKDLLDNPYILLEIIFEEMFKILDFTAWATADAFGLLEKQTLAIASKPEKASAVLPKDLFTALHNLAKHGIFLRENCEEAMATLDDLYNHHEAETGKDLSASQRHTRQALKYRMTLFESSQRRLASLNERISNIIQLSFHIVTQGDSKLMQSENKSMGTIAFMTLWFMPLSTVASIFGSQFMKLQDDHPYHLTVSRDFWLMWVVAVPLTAVVLAVFHRDAKATLVEGLEKSDDRYMGWKALSQTLRRVKAKKGVSDA